MTKKQMEKIMSVKLAGTINGKYADDISDLQRCSLWLNKELFGKELDNAPVITVATHNMHGAEESCRFDQRIYAQENSLEQAFFICINGELMTDTRRVLECIAHNLLHLIQLKYGTIPKRNHDAGFKILAERFGMTCEYTDKNKGNSHVEFTEETWERIKPVADGLDFRTYVTYEKKDDEKKQKQEKFYYVHPNMNDFLVGDSKTLELYVKHNGQIVPMRLDSDGTLMQAVRQNRRAKKQETPDPTARQGVIA